MSFLFINKTLRLNNLKTRTAMNAKISVFVVCVEAIIYLLLYNLHDCTFKGLTVFLKKTYKFFFKFQNKVLDIERTKTKLFSIKKSSIDIPLTDIVVIFSNLKNLSLHPEVCIICYTEIMKELLLPEIFSGVFRVVSNIYDRPFLRN